MLRETLSRCCYAEELAGALLLVQVNLRGRAEVSANDGLCRTLCGASRPAVAPPRRLLAPSVLVRLSFRMKGESFVF